MKRTSQVAGIIGKFAGKRILIAGDLMLDRYWSGEVDRISPEAPVPIVRKVSAFAVPGGAANTACNVKALGAEPWLFGVAGADEAGSELREILGLRGIDCARLSIADGRPTTVKLRIVAHDQQVVRIDEEETGPVDVACAEQVVRRASRLMPKADAVVISDYAKGFATAGVVQGIIAAARNHGKPVVVDPKGADYDRYRGATVIKPNRLELGLLTGLPTRNHEEIVRAGRGLLARAESDAVVVTAGKDGMTLLEAGGKEEHFPSFAREVYDVTGAGDTALAALAVAMGASAPLRQAVWLANLAAGLAVGQPGTVSIPLEKLARAAREAERDGTGRHG